MSTRREVKGMLPVESRPKRANAGRKLAEITAREKTDNVSFYFPLGCMVRAAWTKSRGAEGKLGKQDWYYGYVKSYNIDGTYFIQFDDGDNADHVPETEIELRKPFPEGNISASCITHHYLDDNFWTYLRLMQATSVGTPYHSHVFRSMQN